MAEEDTQWEREVEHFEQNKDKIREEYGETTYVAIRNQEIIDYDEDEFALVKRMNREYPDNNILIQSVKHAEETYIEMPDGKLIKEK